MKQLMMPFALAAIASVSAQAQRLTKAWEVGGLESPESVVYDESNKAYYVSNVAGNLTEKDGNGHIAKLDDSGNVLNLKWIDNLNAPKGLGLYNGMLYVADIDQLVVVDVNTGKMVKSYPAQGATFLNDIEIDRKGVVYVSDTFGGNAIYRLQDDALSLWLKSDGLNFPNGLKIKGNMLYVGTWGVVTNPNTFGTDVPGKLIAVSLKDKSIKNVTSSSGNYDGVVEYGNGFLVSDWMAGRLVSIDKDGKVTVLQSLGKGSADICLVKSKKQLLAPLMLENRLVAYSIE